MSQQANRFMDKMKLGIAKFQRALTDVSGTSSGMHTVDRDFEAMERSA